ncbi:MAG TPA: asparagine synthase (glutamine-hydrolyzing) [Ramlibacter sp.]|jgi:asparagine synthase (glutamine-hydrolysing)|nr:asparagine synthase (glutamine-hydrolyzing) [Ramlibacter sp.]
MCGIFGVFARSPAAPAALEQSVRKGLDRIRHRGPDGSGIWIAPTRDVGFGHARLSVIDLATGDQPMSCENGRYTIIYNGEVYNYLELRQELGAENFRTTSDTEVILRAFIRWGADCVTRLRGMFAFAIWDAQEHRLFIARDRFGIKPLYWTLTKNGLYFASEMKALQPFLDNPQVNKAALSDYFSFQFCLGEKTLLEGVWQLPAAHHATMCVGEAPRAQRYWEVHYDIDYGHSERWFEQRLQELLEDSIRMHMRADVEVGSYVSGGVDSSLIAALARQTRPGERFQGFNGRFEGPEFDESMYARALGEAEKMQMHVADIDELDFVENIRKVIWHLDQPTAGPGSFPQFMVSKKVREHVKVVLGGQGGDEIFGGYARYLVAYFEQCIKGAIEGTLHNGNYVVTYESIIPNLETLRQYKPMIKEFWAEGVFGDRDSRYFRLINRANTFGDALAPGAIDRDTTFAEFQKIFWGENVGKESYFDSMTHFDFKTLLPALLQVEDRMAMAHGVESRVPFLDHPLVEFAASIPADVKFQNGELKRLLKHVYAPKLPDAIRNRKDKMGFPVPLTNWLREKGPASEFVRDVFSSRAAKERSYLSRPVDVDKVLAGQSVYSRNLWALLSLELWHQGFVDAA